MLTLRSPIVAGSDETTRAVRRNWWWRPNTRSRSSDSPSVHRVIINSNISTGRGSSPSVWVRRSLAPRSSSTMPSDTTTVTRPPPYCRAGSAMIGSRAGRE